MSGVLDGLLHAARACGLFALARRLTARRLRILCYHGIAIRDEAEFQPMLFMRPETFRSRLERLSRGGYPILALGDALDRLRRGTLPPCAVVITIDDGWYGTYRDMAPALASHGYPATLYLATYHVEKQTQVFNVAAAYALWKGRSVALDLHAVHPQLAGRVSLGSPTERAAAARRLSALAETLDSASERQSLLERLFSVLGLDFASVRERRMLAFMTPEEAASLPGRGIDLQLHTHRHRFPSADREALADEIASNRAALSRLTPGPFRHLCYPSGEYDRGAFPQLESLQIESATTTVPGMNTTKTPSLELRRFLDSEAYAPIRFEAEVSGFLDLLRRLGGRDDTRARVGNG